MATIADYKVLRDDHFDLTDGQQREFAFDLPNDLSNSSLIVAYQARPLKTQGLQVVARIDISLKFQAHVDTVTIRGETVHGLWEVFPRSAVNIDITNTLIFKCTLTQVRISDIILWYRRNV